MVSFRTPEVNGRLVAASEHTEKNRVTAVSVVASLLLTCAKLAVGLLTGSLGLLAEAAHSALDLVSSVVTFFSVRIAGRPADESHPYGHGRAENLSAIVQGVLLLVTASWIAYESVKRIFFEDVALHPSLWAFAVMASSIVVDMWRSRMLSRAARRYRSRALEADALNFRVDMLSSTVVIAGLGLVTLGNTLGRGGLLHKADAVAALLVGGLIIYKSGGVLLQSVNILLDRAPVGLAERMRRAATSVPGVLDAPSVRLRESGSSTFADVVVTVPRTTSAAEAHEITEEVEEAIRGVDERADTLVHVEPVRSETESAAEAMSATALRMGIRTHHERVWRSDEGEGFEASFHVEVDPYLTLEEAHDLARRLGAALREEYPHLLKVNSHIEVAEPEPGDKREITAEHRELAAKIGHLVLEANVEARAHEVRLYRPGRSTGVDAGSMDAVIHCDFPASTNMGEVHRRTERVEQTLKTRMPGLGYVVIHAEPREGT
jgi:cation diffusion facilitator family transporter